MQGLNHNIDAEQDLVKLHLTVSFLYIKKECISYKNYDIHRSKFYLKVNYGLLSKLNVLFDF